MATPTRLPRVTDPSANGAAEPITVEATAHGARGEVYLIAITCGEVSDIGPAAEDAFASLGIDAGLSDWRAVS